MDNEFIQEQAKTEVGKQWLAYFRTLVDTLYSSRDKPMDQVTRDQATAKFIEETLISKLDVASQKLRPEKGDEYR